MNNRAFSYSSREFCRFRKIVVGWREPKIYIWNGGGRKRFIYVHPHPRPTEHDCFYHDSAVGGCCVENCPIGKCHGLTVLGD